MNISTEMIDTIITFISDTESYLCWRGVSKEYYNKLIDVKKYKDNKFEKIIKFLKNKNEIYIFNYNNYLIEKYIFHKYGKYEYPANLFRHYSTFLYRMV